MLGTTIRRKGFPDHAHHIQCNPHFTLHIPVFASSILNWDPSLEPFGTYWLITSRIPFTSASSLNFLLFISCSKLNLALSLKPASPAAVVNGGCTVLHFAPYPVELVFNLLYVATSFLCLYPLPSESRFLNLVSMELPTNPWVTTSYCMTVLALGSKPISKKY